MHSPSVIAIGEVLIDFIPSSVAKLKDLQFFEKCPGGAPANFAVGISRLGIETAFIGKVGDDPFGEYLHEILEKEGVNVKHLKKGIPGENTSLAFVYYDKNLDRDFFFYRNNAADQKFSKEELIPEFFSNIKFLHIGSISLAVEPIRSATFEAIRLCKEAGGRVSFDPNIRLSFWESEDSLRKMLYKALKHTDIFLPSKDELDFIFPDEKIDEQQKIKLLFEKFPIEIVALKKGNEGCLIRERNGFNLQLPSFEIEITDTTGAGDGFNAGFIFGLVNNYTLEEAGIIGNAIGALVIQSKGAMASLPMKEKLKQFLSEQNLKIEI